MHEYSIKISAPVTKGNLPMMGVDATVVFSGHPMSLFNSVASGGSQGNAPVLSGGYWPRQIVESFDPKSGWHWTIDAVNHPLAQGAV